MNFSRPLTSYALSMGARLLKKMDSYTILEYENVSFLIDSDGFIKCPVLFLSGHDIRTIDRILEKAENFTSTENFANVPGKLGEV